MLERSERFGKEKKGLKPARMYHLWGAHGWRNLNNHMEIRGEAFVKRERGGSESFSEVKTEKE